MSALLDDFTDDELAAIERNTQIIGRRILDRSQGQQPTVLERRWWDDRVMAWAMQDDARKVQLFRFVDVLPMLHTSSAVTQHLQEYLHDADETLPAALRLGLAVAAPGSIVGRAVAMAARKNAAGYARRFIAGSKTTEVLAAAMRERKLRRSFTLDVLGEAVTSELEADRYLQIYLDLLRTVSPVVNAWPDMPELDRGPDGPLPRMNVSVKLSALDSQFDPIDPEGSYHRVAVRLRELLRAARRQRAYVHVDMESYHVKDLTLRIFQRVLMEDEFRETRDVGIVIQCYLCDAERDIRDLYEWAQRRGTPVWVRLVKGAYWDYETVRARAQGWSVPVFQEKWQSDATFERVSRFVLRHADVLRPALGSHNVRSLAHGIATAEFLRLPPEAYEIQMLYGMADGEKQAIVDHGQRLRIYMPYGELIPGMAYLVRRLLENTSNNSFLRASFTDHVAPEILLMNPREHAQPSPSIEPSGGPPIVVQAPARVVATFQNQPHADFAVAANRTAMAEAVARVRQQFGLHHPLEINGHSVDTRERISSLNPSHLKQIVGTTASATMENVAAAVAAAREALPEWHSLGVDRRADFLDRAADELRRRHWELAAWQVHECGKTWREADADVGEAIDFCRYYALQARQLLARPDVDVPGEANRFMYRSRGVTAVIAPWNFPLAILTGMTTAALVTGNTVIMKPAEQSSIIAAKLMEVFHDLELPPGVLNYLPGAGETVGAALVEHPDVALVTFTGSRTVGLEINRRAAEVSAAGLPMVKRVIAELGGKNAVIVDDDADLDEAVLGVVRSAFGFQGQKCSACSRVIVLEAIYETFLERLIESVRSLRVGPAEEPATSVGPVIDAEARERVLSYVALGRREGREVLAVDVGPLAAEGNYVGPHIFADIAPSARLAQEEVFGPVLAVLRAKDFDEAISIANGTDYALTCGVFSRSPAHLDRAAELLECGNLYLNRGITGAMVGRQPFGGFKLSGIGSQAGGPDYLLQFVIPRTITENTMRRGFAPGEIADMGTDE